MNRTAEKPRPLPGIVTSHTRLDVVTRGHGFTDITQRIADWIGTTRFADGVVTIFIRHTSASLIIQENTDPDVQRDLTDWLGRLAPEERNWRHSLEGPDDMPAHAKSAITATSLSIPVIARTLALGQWQAIYVVEHRAHRQQREVIASFIGTCADRDSPSQPDGSA